jgi:3-dehydroquinate synthase
MSEITMSNLILTGFMGTGKTTIAKMAAERLGCDTIDMDDIITGRMGKSVAQIFADEGEPFFRALEASLCHEMSVPRGMVISTGGGTLIPQANFHAISGNGNVVICLNARPEDIFKRLEVEPRGRPMVDNENDRYAAALKLLEKRRPAYARIRLQVETSGRTPESIAQEVIHIYEREVARNASRLVVTSPTNHYDILCDNGLLAELPGLLHNYNLRGRTVIATDSNIAQIYGDGLAKILPDAALITMPAGEEYKNQQSVSQLYRDFVRAGLDRNGIVIALGGGVVGDTVGYAAASYMRGVRLVQIPTSLLAMVDSSVGGKVGVDIPEGKNLVGAFKQPELVIIDPDVLKTLPEIELKCGMTEAIKHGLLANAALLERADDIMAGDAEAIRQTVQVKVDVVQRDPYENGERAHLNLGHTFAHAIERISNYQLRHGEAVSIGLMAAARLSGEIAGLDAEKVSQICQIVDEIGLPTNVNGFAPDDVWDAMQTDKKWRDGRSHFIVLEDIGKPAIVQGVPRDTVIAVLESLIEKGA